MFNIRNRHFAILSRNISMSCERNLIGYVSDLEGNLEFWNRYVSISKVLFRQDGILHLKDNCQLVFGGDVCDRGKGDIRIIVELLQLKRQYPGRIHFILGNRDINKLRLPFTLHSSTLQQYPSVYWVRRRSSVTEEAQNRSDKLKWTLTQTMGCPHTFEYRRVELMEITGSPTVSDEEVTESFSNMVWPIEDNLFGAGTSGILLNFMEAAGICKIIGDTAFVHGAFHTYNLGWVPEAAMGPEYEPYIDTSRSNDGNAVPGAYLSDIRVWARCINAFCGKEFADYRAHTVNYLDQREKGTAREPDIWEVTGGYDHSQPGSKLLQYGMGWLADRSVNPSVIYASYFKFGQWEKLEQEAAEYLLRNGIRRVVVAHQPHGDAPHIMNQHGVQSIQMDSSYSRNVLWRRQDVLGLGSCSSATPPPRKKEGEEQAAGEPHCHWHTAEHYFRHSDHHGKTSPKGETVAKADDYWDRVETRSKDCVAELLLCVDSDDNVIEIRAHGTLTNRCSFDFQIPPPGENSFVARETSEGGWYVKASGVKMPQDSETEYYLLNHCEGTQFKNRLVEASAITSEFPEN